MKIKDERVLAARKLIKGIFSELFASCIFKLSSSITHRDSSESLLTAAKLIECIERALSALKKYQVDERGSSRLSILPTFVRGTKTGRRFSRYLKSTTNEIISLSKSIGRESGILPSSIFVA